MKTLTTALRLKGRVCTITMKMVGVENANIPSGRIAGVLNENHNEVKDTRPGLYPLQRRQTMKLLNRFLSCGGQNGCGIQFVFNIDETVEDAHAVFTSHRNEPNHAKAVWNEQNRKRLVQGLSPLNSFVEAE